MSDVAIKIRTALPIVPMRFYKHCGSLGQVKYGDNLALRSRRPFKHAFEIVTAGQTAIVNQR